MKHSIIWLVGIAAAIAVIAFIFYPDKEESNMIDSLRKENDSLKVENYLANQRDSVKEKIVDSLINVIRDIDLKIIRTKEYHETIIHHYDTATARELEQFFSERYPQ